MPSWMGNHLVRLQICMLHAWRIAWGQNSGAVSVGCFAIVSCIVILERLRGLLEDISLSGAPS